MWLLHYSRTTTTELLGWSQTTVAVLTTTRRIPSIDLNDWPIEGIRSKLDGELVLDGGQFLGRSLNLRTLEPVVRGHRVPDTGEADDRHDGKRCVVEVIGVDRRVRGQHEQDADDDHPHDGNPPEDRSPLAKLPRPGRECRTIDPSQEDRDQVRDVQADHRDRRHCGVGRTTGRAGKERGRHQYERAYGTEPGRVHRHAAALADVMPVVRERHGAVSREGVDHARVRGDRGDATEELRPND